MKRRYFPGCRAAVNALVTAALVVAPLFSSAASAQARTHKHTVAYKSVTLVFDSALAKEYLAETVPALPLEEKTDKPDGVAPQHIVITLRDSYAGRLHREPSSMYALPQISIFPTSDPSDPGFDGEFPTVHRAVNDLDRLLGRRAVSPAESIPFLPWADERQLFVGRKRLVRFRDGRGVLFLTQYDQEQSPINNELLVYTFQGLTDDNAWYVSAVFPVAAQGIPASGRVDNAAAFRAGYEEYVKQTAEKLNKLPAKKFTPDLALLEEIIRSLKVGPR
ncbi:MAG TPA: hypothetical protein VF514_10685 [Bacteroidota bacterium]